MLRATATALPACLLVGCSALQPLEPMLPGSASTEHSVARMLALQDDGAAFRDLAHDTRPLAVDSAVDPDGAPSQGHETSTEEFFLPFFGEAARERGYELPRPLGIGANVMFINRPTEISAVRAGTNGTGLNDVEFLDFEAEAAVRTAIARFDAWLLPMVNVYLLAGYIWNTSAVQTTVNLPGAPSTPIVSEGNLEGPTYGAGVTVAGGYKEFFATADVNVTKSELGELSEFIARLYTIRAGWNTKLDGKPFRLYTGATYWDTKRTIEGSIPLPGPVINSVEFAVDQEPVDPITAFVGSTLTVNDHLWFMFELGGWEGTQSVIAGVIWRF